MSAVVQPGGARGVPVAVTAYVGRDREVAELRALSKAKRLVNVVGPPGVGKTRLAARVATELAGELADGVVFVELAELRDAALLANTIMVALGPAGQARSEEQVLIDYLRDRQVMLVLDNCEHLIDECADLAAAMVRDCPRVIVLATSRQSLGVVGEHLYPLPPLAVPEPDSLRSPAGLRGFDAVALFVDRATSVVPSFEITEDNYHDVARVIRRLDGIPLAIELAAVRLRSLSVRQLAERLTRRLPLLTGAPRTASSRHRSLHGTLDWSFALCTPDERLVWARAGVFSGSFDLTAAEQVCGGDGLAPDALLDAIIGLVDKSVLIPRQHAGDIRYRMLGVLREYGREQLSAGEVLRLGRRHRDCYASRSARLREARGTTDAVPSCHRMRPDHPNLRVALEYCLTTPGEADAGLAIVNDLNLYWQLWRLRAEARTWLDRLLRKASPDTPLSGLALIHDANYSLFEGDLARCTELLAEADGVVTRTNEGSLLSRAKVSADLLAEYQGEPDRAAGIFAELVTEFRATGDRPRELVSYYHHGWCTGFSGDPNGARVILRDGLALSREYGDLNARRFLLEALTMIEAEYGDAATAVHCLRDMLTAAGDAGIELLDGEALATVGWVADSQGHHARAATLYGITEAANRKAGYALHTSAMIEERHVRHIQRTREALGDDKFEACFTAGAAMSEADSIRYVFGTPQALRPPPGADRLTSREWEITGLIRQGMTNREIAEHLVISTRTAEAHVAHILAKLGLSRRSQVAVWAVRQDTTDPA